MKSIFYFLTILAIFLSFAIGGTNGAVLLFGSLAALFLGTFLFAAVGCLMQ